MLNCLIFSKDRPAQLDLLLRSIEENFKELDNIQILYKQTSSDFKAGYDRVKALHSSKTFQFIEEINFVSDVMRITRAFERPHSIVLVDDEVVIRDFNVLSSLHILDDNDYVGISLRLHSGINHTYTTNTLTTTTFEKHPYMPNILTWQWRQYNFLGEFGYVGNINSCIYKTYFLKLCVALLSYRNVNSLEEAMFNARINYGKYMSCFENAKTISIANNKTQTEIPTNKCSGKAENTLENLNKKFLDGYRISTDNIYGYKSNMATTELDYKWEKE